MTPKMGFFNFGLEQKLGHHSCVKFHGESDSDGFKAQKPILDLLFEPLIEYGIFGEGSQICYYCLRRKGHKSQLLAGEGSQISLF